MLGFVGFSMIENISIISIILNISVIILVVYDTRRRIREFNKIRSEFDGIIDAVITAEKEFKSEANKDLYFSKRTQNLPLPPQTNSCECK